jgi:hypothetical protein
VNARVTLPVSFGPPAHRLAAKLVVALLVGLVVVAAIGSMAPSAAADAPEFADWTAINASTATGTLLGRPISLSGTHVFPTPVSVLDGSWPYFAGPDFSPPLAKTDVIQIAGFPGDAYTLQFGAPLTDPVLEIGSLASRLDFPSATQITRLSGDTGFSVSGSSVIGTPKDTTGADGVNDANGTVRLSGTFQSLSFTATPLYAGPEDGVLLQLGAVAPPPPPPPTPPAPAPPVFFPHPPSPFRPAPIDIHVTGIEVTQAIQFSGCSGCAGTLPSRDQANTETPGRAAYQGVRMSAGHFTVVRVFANFTQPADRASLSGATAQLEVLDADGQRISLLTPDSGPAALSKPSACGACVGADERANAGASFSFLVPWQETLHRTLSFRATVRPALGLGLFAAPVQCAACKGNTFLLSGVPFVSTATVPIHPIPLTVGGVRTSQSENQVFGSAQVVLPLNVQIFPYEAPLAVDTTLPVTSVQASAAVAKRASDEHLDGTQYPVGVFIDGTAGLGGSTDNGKVLYGGAPPISIVRDDRPLTSAMHEIGHGVGLPHADTGSAVPVAPGNPPLFTGRHPDGTPDCGGNSNGQVGETWAPDNEGLIQGIGLDRRNWDVFRTGSLPRALVAGYPAASDAYYDFMSYCANINESSAPPNKPNAWISVRNWNRLIGFHPPAQVLAADVRAHAHVRAASDTSLRIIATVDGAGNTSIYDVAPGQRTAAEPTAGSPYRVELRNAAGAILTSVVPATTTVHVDGEPGAVLLEATLPLVPSTAAIVVTAGGSELARRARSPHAPTAAIRVPRPGSHVGATRTTLVQWTAKDADGDRLTSTVDYSADAGRHWTVVAGDVSGTSVRVPSRALSASHNGRLRVRVNDGFDVATVTSGRLLAAGAPPVVRIGLDGGGGRVRANATLLLRGTAFDDAGRPLTRTRLKWDIDGHLIGHGELVTVRSLPADAKRIRLVATDARGRSAQARVSLKVVAARPTFVVAHAPTTAAATARHIRITVASSVPAELTIAGVRRSVDRKPRTITIAVRPGHSTLRLRYALSAAGGVTRGTYVIGR